MSRNDWSQAISKLSFYAGVLAAHGDAHDSLAETFGLAGRLEELTYRPRYREATPVLSPVSDLGAFFESVDFSALPPTGFFETPPQSTPMLREPSMGYPKQGYDGKARIVEHYTLTNPPPDIYGNSDRWPSRCPGGSKAPKKKEP